MQASSDSVFLFRGCVRGLRGWRPGPRESSAVDPKPLARLKLDEGAPAIEEAAPPTWLPPAQRFISIGDLHGDLAKAREALQVAEVIDENDHWVGGETVVVQVGDLFDRGGEEIKVLYLLEKLRGQAQKAGGDVHITIGNHEIMNIEGDFRYATAAGLEFRSWAHWYSLGNVLKENCASTGPQADIYCGVAPSYPDGLRAVPFLLVFCLSILSFWWFEDPCSCMVAFCLVMWSTASVASMKRRILYLEALASQYAKRWSYSKFSNRISTFEVKFAQVNLMGRVSLETEFISCIAISFAEC